MDFRKIFCVYNEKIVRVYQAYNPKIAGEAIKLQTFGDSFKLGRMTWIKPSFLWMMYRSGWGTKEGQERILGIDIKREGFISVLSNAVFSAYNEKIYLSHALWRQKLEESDVRCQWDPERDVYGNPIGRRSIQLGLKGDFAKKYVNEWIVGIEDLTKFVCVFRRNIERQEVNLNLLPKEKEYIVDGHIQKILGINETTHS
jgi:hypothetical protein